MYYLLPPMEVIKEVVSHIRPTEIQFDGQFQEDVVAHNEDIFGSTGLHSGSVIASDNIAFYSSGRNRSICSFWFYLLYFKGFRSRLRQYLTWECEIAATDRRQSVHSKRVMNAWRIE